MRRAHDAMNLATQGNWSIAEDGFDFLSPDDLSASLMELRKAEDSLAGIEQQLDEA